MSTLTLTARRKVTFERQVLDRVGIRRGDRVTLDLLPDGRAELRADRPTRSWRTLHGMLKGKGNGARLSIDEIGDATIEAGAADRGAETFVSFDRKAVRLLDMHGEQSLRLG